MARLYSAAKTTHQKEIVKIFESMQGAYTLWQLWGDFVTMIACEISNAVDVEHRPKRVEMYNTISSKYSQKEMERFASIFAHLVDSYEIDQDQDILGELYMALGLGNDHNGQFFTPYEVCRCMAQMVLANAATEIEKKHWISINDPAVGAGAILIAAANTIRSQGINYQQHCLFVAQEIDFVTACMCYIQLSLLGCPGYVYVGDTLSDPCTSIDGRALIPSKPEKCWFTPMYFHETWNIRRMIECMHLAERAVQTSSGKESKTPEIDSMPAVELVSAPSEPVPEPAMTEKIELRINENGQLMLF